MLTPHLNARAKAIFEGHTRRRLLPEARVWWHLLLEGRVAVAPQGARGGGSRLPDGPLLGGSDGGDPGRRERQWRPEACTKAAPP